MQDVLTNKGKGRAELTNLPRKINICVSPTRDDFPHTHINDLGFQAIKNADGELVFNVEVGGYFSVKRNAISIPLGVSVKPDQVRFHSPLRPPCSKHVPKHQVSTLFNNHLINLPRLLRVFSSPCSLFTPDCLDQRIKMWLHQLVL